MVDNQVAAIEVLVQELDNGEISAKKAGIGIEISGPNMPRIIISRAQDLIGPPDAIYRIVFPTKNNFPGYEIFLGPNGVIPYKRD